MIKEKPSCKNQLNSNSTLFLQLGILLALVIVHSLFELKFSKQIFDLPDKTIFNDEMDLFVFPPFKMDKKQNPKEKIKVKTTKLINDFDLVKDKEPFVSNDLLPNKPDAPINFDSIFSEVPIIDEYINETLPFILVEQAPRYPGCIEKTEIAYKKCFNEKMKKFIAKKFNSNMEIGLSGKQKIHVQFEIDKNGDIVNIRARAPHKRLEKEAIKVVKKLPKMEPGKQRNRAVGVKYVMPIALYLD
ncbi:MAG: energy transducer TonB [Flavobacteriaceae bacterium]|nr:energy transducer TonB [Flavobacteriaceae bacterium]